MNKILEFKNYVTTYIKATSIARIPKRILLLRLTIVLFLIWEIILSTVIVGSLTRRGILSPIEIPLALIIIALPIYSIYILSKIPSITKDLLMKLQPTFVKISAQKQDELLAGFVKLSWTSIIVLSVMGISITLIGLSGYAYVDSSTSIFFALVIGVPVSLFFMVFAKFFNIVSRLYELRNAELEIDIFNLSPIYSISQLTQKLALYILPYATLFGILGLAMGKTLLVSDSETIFRIVFISIGPVSLLISLYILDFIRNKENGHNFSGFGRCSTRML